MHLVSNYRYPLMSSLNMETAVEYLISAPKVVRELQTVHWMFLDGPPDGTVMLVWQPLNHLGTSFASDGYVWADVEQVYTREMRGYTVEVHLHRCGYHPPNETMATHCRKRYRLTPSKSAGPNAPACDPSLWLIYYSKTPPVDHLPANRIPITPHTQNTLAQRRFLQSQGQLVRKEFMLHDRNSWPTINLPPQVGQQNIHPQGTPYGSHLLARQQQGPFYQPQPGQNIPPPQSKSARGSRAGAAANMVNAAVADYSLEEEEVSTGDLLDNITPRDISKMRYRHHHEWMDEIFGSPYSVKQIVPVDLGLGRKGELESLTTGYFEAPTGPALGQKELTASGTPGRLEAGKAEEFANSVSRKVADVTADIERMKRKHAKRLEQMKRTSTLKEAELALRDAFIDPDDTGNEFWRIEGHLNPIGGEESPQIDYNEAQRPKTKVEDIIKHVETTLGKSIVPISEVACVDKGGLLEKIEPAKPTTGTSAGDIDMGEAALELSQFDAAAVSAPQQPSATPNSTILQTGGEKTSAPAPSATTQQSASASAQAPVTSKPDTSGDVEMGGLDGGQAPASADQEEWVMVNKDGSLPKESGSTDNKPGSAEASGAAATETPASGIQGLTPAANTDLGEASGLETSNFDDAAGFSHIDSAGDALAAYGEQNDGLDLGDLDNSAFGDAFHASEAERGDHNDSEEIS
ncbi:hypothetical protein FQN52_004214 [Onygenales sp. PD_12]|nr:hypothetical protein FQN52_004214 [Onygenales sp. PD_12]